MKDPYSEQGEFYDVVSGGLWKTRKVFLDVLAGLANVDGVILDIGSGTGHGVVAVSEVLPGVEIFAVEPSSTMRATLLSRIMQTGDLQQRVTVIPTTFENFELPDRVRAVLLLACIGIFDDGARQNFWAKLAPHMPMGGLVLFDVMIDKPAPVAKMRVAEIPVGRHTYHAWVEGVPQGDKYQKWQSTFQITKGDQVLLERHIESVWRTLSLEDVAREAEPFGFAYEPLPADPRIPSGLLRKIAQ